ncbi:efflux RND transporter periplasmic adaptor subunit [Planctomycetaceae bacterium SH139]
MTVNQQTVEETKKQIRVLVNEIAALGKSGVPAEEYYPQFLQRVVTALAAVGGAIWLLDDDRNVRLQYQINMSDALLDEQGDDALRHRRLVRRVASANQSLLVPPYSGTTDGEAEGNPSKYLLVLTPLSHDKKVDGLIEVFQRPEAAPATQQGYLRFLQQMSELAGEWIKNERLAHFSDRQVLWQQADTFARLSHESLDLKETAYIVANEGRRLIGCDRVSVAILKGRKCKVQAISGQDTIENRSNIVAALNKLATRVVAAGEPLWHDGSTEDLPPQIEEALEEYVDQSYGRHIAVLPLREPVRLNAAEQATGAAGEIDRDGDHRGETIGALIVEQIESSLPPDVFHSRVDLVYEHGTRAIANSMHYNNLFLMPVWRTLGHLTWVLRARTLPKTLAVVGLILVLILGLVFIPLELELEANGTVEPTKSTHVFSPVDGVVRIPDNSDIKHGTFVKEGQLLFELENRELEIKLTELEGEINRTREQLASVQGQLTLLTRRDFDPAEATKLQGERLGLLSQQKTLEESYQLRKKQEEELQIRAPIDGVITTWNLKKLLNNRPVMTGQVLFDIADLNQPMYLRLKMPDKRMHHLESCRQERGADGEIMVDFILATNPSESFSGKLDTDAIEQRTSTDKDDGEVVRMKVTLDKEVQEQLQADLRPGAKVIADVRVGKRASGYVLGYEIYEWLCKFFF